MQSVAIEPFRIFQRPLEALMAKWGTRVESAAAWIAETRVTFFVAKDPQASSVVEAQALAFNGLRTPKNATVRALDLSRMLLSHGAGTYLMVKLDVEGAEYTLLPQLIATGALCRVRHLLIEWHLNALPAAKRLSGVGLRESYKSILRACPSTSSGAGADVLKRTLLNDEERENNDEEVPGLKELLERHTPAPNRTSTSAGGTAAAASRSSHRRPFAQAHAKLVVRDGGQR